MYDYSNRNIMGIYYCILREIIKLYIELSGDAFIFFSPLSSFPSSPPSLSYTSTFPRVSHFTLLIFCFPSFSPFFSP